jgi:diphosphomevalonate decarboxylase
VTEAAALAHPNFALSKYWGKRPGGGNLPAVPSLSVTMAGFATRTRVCFDGALAADRVFIGGGPASAEARARVVALLDRVRAAAGRAAFADVTSESDFPMGSGLASSASGFAALALAASRAAGLDWDAARVSDLARRSSASAARSLFGGFVELDAGPADARESDLHPARALAPASQLPLAVLVAVTSEAEKAIGSTEGMKATMERSPYAKAWLEEAPRLHARLREALLAGDFDRVGELAESSALAMHATAIAAGIVYWNAATLEALAAVRALRARGVAAYFTVDAGPHVKVLVRPGDAGPALAALAAAPGVLRVARGRVGPGAHLIAASPPGEARA